MKITIGKFSLEAELKLAFGDSSIDLNTMLRVFLPPILFICVCIGIFLGFLLLLLPFLDQFAIGLVGWSWLSLLILYIALGIAFTYVFTRSLRRHFQSLAPGAQKGMLTWSGLPFYALFLFFLVTFISMFFYDAAAAAAFANLVLLVLFGLTSVAYFLLTRLFLRRSQLATQP